MESPRDNDVKAKRIRCNPPRRWAAAEKKSLIEFLLENRQLEPSAQAYYKQFCMAKNLTMEWKLVRSKVRNMRVSYNKAKTWEGSTGAGSMSGETIKSTLLKMCIFFYELEDIFGSRVSECAAIEDTMTAEYLDFEGAVETQIAVPIEEPESSQGPDCVLHLNGNESSAEISCTPSTSRKGIYSRTGVSEIMKLQAEVISFKKEKLEAELAARDRELVIRERELVLKEKNFDLKERNFKSEEKLKVPELEMKERLAMEELKLKYKQLF
ncbi:uncharacterized protein LOC120780146 isoform X2 [Bactrocera tryoni]|uniref:uncharacterized protein LOC120780146 isoform X2 n=1 Tax=Bactrocera tryoni TaxID=59916 RepID=UPI001A95A2DC|nr:uncharacterized protein LOC120780146 isoform X2 [Bactrocera tryoni]